MYNEVIISTKGTDSSVFERYFFLKIKTSLFHSFSCLSPKLGPSQVSPIMCYL